MPFLKGAAPIRRTLDYLYKGDFKLNKNLEVFALYYNDRVYLNQAAHGGDPYGREMWPAEKLVPMPNHQGARDFFFWNYTQLQFQNPNIQFYDVLNMTPTPYIKAFFNSGEEVVLDIDNKDRQYILDRVLKVLGAINLKPIKVPLKYEASTRENSALPLSSTYGVPYGFSTVKDVGRKVEIQYNVNGEAVQTEEGVINAKEGVMENEAHFGWRCKRQCICQMPGQVPCPGVVHLPFSYQSKLVGNWDINYTQEMQPVEM